MSSEEMDPANTRDRSRSPLRSQSPRHSQNQSPRHSQSQSPRRSPSQSRRHSPSPLPNQSPSPLPNQSPSPLPNQSPSPLPIQSPSALPNESPSPLPNQSPNHSPSPLPNQSPSPLPNHTPSPLPNQSPSPLPSQSSSTSKAITPKNKILNLLHLKNIPKDWTIMNIKKFIKAGTAYEVNFASKQSFIEILKDKHNKPKGECVIKFKTPNYCRYIYKQLSGCSYNGIRINIQMKCESSFPNIKFPDLIIDDYVKYIKKGINKFINKEQGSAHLNPSPRLEIAGNSDKYERYGLSMSFLKSMGITLPLSNKIFVGNLEPSVEETKLWAVFGLAGVVLSVVKIHNEIKPFAFARIEYDHPVEAVQAISMFNNQILCNNKMVVQMDKFRKKIMPTGLEGIGPGLGPNGETLRGVRNAVELLPFKESIMKELEKLNNDNNKWSDNQQSQLMGSAFSNPSLSSVPNNSFTSNQLLGGLNMNMSDNNFISSLSNLLNPQNLNPLLNIQGIQNYLNTLSAVQSQSTSQNSGNSQNLLDAVHNMMSASQNMMGTSPNVVGSAQNMMGTNQNMMGINQNAMNNNQNMIANNQNMVSTNQNMVSTNQNMVSTNQNVMTANQNRISTNQNIMSTSQYMGTNQNMTSIDHSFGYNQEGPVYSNNEMPNEFVRYNVNLKSHNTFGESRNDYKRDNRSNIKEEHNRELEDRKSMSSTDMLTFMYLPPHVTAEALSRKMREVGDLKFVEITGNGRALVRFMKSEDAARCKYLFDRTKVDGQTIRVKYF